MDELEFVSFIGVSATSVEVPPEKLCGVIFELRKRVQRAERVYVAAATTVYSTVVYGASLSHETRRDVSASEHLLTTNCKRVSQQDIAFTEPNSTCLAP